MFLNCFSYILCSVFFVVLFFAIGKSSFHHFFITGFILTIHLHLPNPTVLVKQVLRHLRRNWSFFDSGAFVVIKTAVIITSIMCIAWEPGARNKKSSPMLTGFDSLFRSGLKCTICLAQLEWCIVVISSLIWFATSFQLQPVGYRQLPQHLRVRLC